MTTGKRSKVAPTASPARPEASRVAAAREAAAALAEKRRQAELEGRSDEVFELFILLAIYVLAFSVRLFSVLRFESIIHEFDPWFNFRVTKYLVREGFFDFWNFYDETTWYPLGRYIGGTVYPGLMWTAGLLYHVANLVNLPVDIRNVCVLLAPFMASNTTVAVYLFTKELWTRAAAITAAMFIAMAPGYISRSVAGSYDNEAVAIFAIVFTFYLWTKSVRTGSMFWAAMCALSYFYMVTAWGGYIFLINLIPFHVLVLLVSGRYSRKIYVVYTTFYTLGTILSMQVMFVGFQPVQLLSSPEHLGAFGVFGLLQLVSFFTYLRSMVSKEHMRLLVNAFLLIIAALFVFVILLSVLGYVPALTGRFKTLLGSTKNIAIVHSVSEHQPSPWTTFFFDNHCLTFLAPAGMYFVFQHVTDYNIFIVLYLVFASYFSGIMVRLVLVFCPAACVMGGIGASEMLVLFMNIIAGPSAADADENDVQRVLRDAEREEEEKKQQQLQQQQQSEAEDSDATNAVFGASSRKKKGKGVDVQSRIKKVLAERAKKSGDDDKYAAFKHLGLDGETVNPLAAWVGVFVILFMLVLFVYHCSWVTSVAYSSPSVVLQARQHDGSRIIFDDFREAYYWLWQNTAEDAKIMSWWDYGYQIKGMGNRTTIVDNNTRNNTHIATVGLAMASNEDMAYPILRRLDVDYVLVVFGGKIGYSSDDINKFLWMVRISSGVFPRIVESDFFSKDGAYTVDARASKTMRNCLMYKMCYYRFGEMTTEYGRPTGWDRVRHAEIGKKNIQLKYLEEAFTTEHWMVRIYRVKKESEHIGQVDFPKLSYKKRSSGSLSSSAKAHVEAFKVEQSHKRAKSKEVRRLQKERDAQLLRVYEESDAKLLSEAQREAQRQRAEQAEKQAREQAEEAEKQEKRTEERSKAEEREAAEKAEQDAMVARAEEKATKLVEEQNIKKDQAAAAAANDAEETKPAKKKKSMKKGKKQKKKKKKSKKGKKKKSKKKGKKNKKKKSKKNN